MGTNSCKDKKGFLGNLLPREINGWEAIEKDKLYDPRTIFDYIDGAGEIYRSYNFKQLLARRFSKDAFGVFTHDLEGDNAGIGRGSTYNEGLLSFWKGRFFISLYAEEETEDAKKALFAFGKKVDSSIEEEGEEPDIVSLLPEEARVEKSIHYFHNHMILNYHFYVSDENILLLDQQTEAVLGAYSETNEKFYLLLVCYPEKEKVLEAYENFTQAYMPDSKETGLVQTEDKKWTAARIKKDFLAIVFNGPSADYAKGMLEQVLKKIN